MEEVKQFIEAFLKLENEVWTVRRTKDLDLTNSKFEELQSFAVGEMIHGLGLGKQNKLLPEMMYKVMASNPSPKQRILYKISAYKNKKYGDLWVAYLSMHNPLAKSTNDTYHTAYIISSIEGELKIVASMSVALADSDLRAVGWDKSVYNPFDIDINNLGEFISTERYVEPEDDGFSLKEYLADK